MTGQPENAIKLFGKRLLEVNGYHVYNIKQMTYRKRKGTMCPGLPDQVAIHPGDEDFKGAILWIEYKMPKGTLRPEQEVFKNLIDKLTPRIESTYVIIKHITCRNPLEDLEEYIDIVPAKFTKEAFEHGWI